MTKDGLLPCQTQFDFEKLCPVTGEVNYCLTYPEEGRRVSLRNAPCRYIAKQTATRYRLIVAQLWSDEGLCDMNNDHVPAVIVEGNPRYNDYLVIHSTQDVLDIRCLNSRLQAKITCGLLKIGGRIMFVHHTIHPTRLRLRGDKLIDGAKVFNQTVEEYLSNDEICTQTDYRKEYTIPEKIFDKGIYVYKLTCGIIKPGLSKAVDAHYLTNYLVVFGKRRCILVQNMAILVLHMYTVM